MSEERQRAPTKRYAVLSKETVRVFAESSGYANLSDEVTEILAEDVSYRLRDLIQQSYEFMKHSKRRKMLTKDFTAALRNSDVQPIFGHGLSEPMTFTQAKDSDVFFCNDPEINLATFALAPVAAGDRGRTTFKGTWLAVEGVRTASCLPPANAQGKPIERGPRPLSEDFLLYFDVVTRAILGTDVEPMKTALKDLRTNPRLLPLLPYLVNFVANGVKTVSHDTAQLSRLLHTLKSLVLNPFSFFEPKPYLTILVQTIEFCGIEPLAASINPQNDHWTLRDYAARLLGLITRRFDSPRNQLRQSNLTMLYEVLSDTLRPFCSHYGAIMATLAIGLEAVHEIILPMLPTYMNHLDETLRDVSYVNAIVKSDAQKVYGALVMVAEYVIRAHIQQMKASQSCSEQDAEVEPGKDVNRLDQPHNPVAPGNHSSTLGNQSAAVFNPPDAKTSKQQSFSQIYSMLYEYFGDSLVVRLPIVRVSDFYTRAKDQVTVSFADETTARTGEELLRQFLEQPPKVAEDMDTEDKSNSSVASVRSSRSEEILSDVGDDADLTIKSTETDPSKGIRLTILKRPKTKAPPTNPAPLVPPPAPVPPAPPLPDPQLPDPAVKLQKMPKLGRKSSLPKSVPKSEVFEITQLRDRDVIFVFSFQGRIQHCVFSERQKALILARDMALQHAAVSKYRTMCAALPYFGKRSKAPCPAKKKNNVWGTLDLGLVL